VIHHTSGVTKRSIEFDFTAVGVESQEINDFGDKFLERSKAPGEPSSFSILRKVTRNSLRFVLEKFGFIIHANNDKSFGRLRPWTFSIRGHYTNLTLGSNEITSLHTLLAKQHYLRSAQQADTVLHYRLGDLLHLTGKSPISPSRIEFVIQNEVPKTSSILVLTDSSVSEFLNFVSNSHFLKDCQPINLDPIDTLQACIEANSFVGTTAKLSLWAAIFRQIIKGKTSHLPNELRWVNSLVSSTKWY
jgi:hypothetical protein